MKINKFSIKTGKIKNNASFRIVHLSDLHKKQFGLNNSVLTDKVRELKPDAIFITGDMVSRSVKNLDCFKPFIHTLSSVAPVYYSLGNHETDMKTVNPKLHSALINEIQKNCILLDNETKYIKNENISLKISGLTIFQECYKNNGKYKNLRKLKTSDIENFLGLVPEKDCINILLAHNPIFFETYADYGSDIILSGHVHGGCVRLPVLGGILSPERKFFPKYYSGIYKKNNSSMIVSCGLGKFRLFNPPEIIVLDLS